MTEAAGVALAIALAALTAVVVAAAVAQDAIARSPRRLMRANVRELEVPAVLGFPLVAGFFAGFWVTVAAMWAGVGGVNIGATGAALWLVVLVAAPAGLMDDLRGSEIQRGFGGHLTALRSGRFTGGIGKLLLVGAASLIAASFLAEGVELLEVALLIALSANLFNLLDRAPGRAGKVGLLALLPLMAFGDLEWSLAAAGLVGALIVILVVDLRELGMLGDAGANPLGAAIGLGLAASLEEPWRLLALVIAVLANVASERWSFSEVIATNRALRAFDRIGRRPA